jgi:hypothetical protein
MNAKEAYNLTMKQYTDVNYMEIVFEQIRSACENKRSSCIFNLDLFKLYPVRTEIGTQLKKLGYKLTRINGSDIHISWDKYIE